LGLNFVSFDLTHFVFCQLCSTLNMLKNFFQNELRHLKEHVQILESALNPGVLFVPGHSSGGAAFTDQNDSMADLAINKTQEFADTRHGTPIVTRTQ